MDSLNNILSRVWSALGFGWSRSQEKPQQTIQQTTSSWQGSNMMELMPQSRSELPQVNQRPRDLSPRAFDAQNVIDNIWGYLNSGPTTNYDFLWNIQNQQTPQWVFNQQTQEVVDNQWQAIWVPNQVVSSPYQEQKQAQAQNTSLQIQTPAEIIQEASSQNTTQTALSNAWEKFSNQLDQSFTLPTTDEVPEALMPIKPSTTTIGEGVAKDEESFKETTIWSIVNTVGDVARWLWWIIASWFIENWEKTTYDTLDNETKILLNPQFQRENEELLSSRPESIDRIWNYSGVGKIADIYANNTLTDEEKDQAVASAFPWLQISKAREIAQSAIENREVKSRKVARIQGIDFDDVNAVANSNQTKSTRYMENSSTMIDSLALEYKDNLLNSPYNLSLSDISGRTNAYISEVNRQARLIANAAASVNTMQESNTAVYWNPIPQLTDEFVGKLIERQLDTINWTTEASANGLDSNIFLKDKLEQLWYDWPAALTNYTMAPLDDWARGLPESAEKDIIVWLISTSMSLDDWIKSIEVAVNLVNQENWFRRANALLQWVWLVRLWTIKNASWILWWVMSQSLNAEQDLSRVDFTEDWVALLAHVATDLAQITPELTLAAQDLAIGNALWWLAAAWTTKVINLWRAWTNSLGKVPLIWKIWSNIPKPVAKVLNYSNKVFQWAVRNVPRFADELVQEALITSSLQSFTPWVNTKEEYDNFALWVGFAGIIAAFPSVWRVATNWLPNTYWVYGVTDELTIEMIKNTNINARLRQIENDRFLQEIKDLQSEWLLTSAEAKSQAIQSEKRRVPPEEKQILISQVRNEPISLEDIAAAKLYHQNALDKVELLRRSDPEWAKTIERKAWVQNKVNEIYNTAINSTDELNKLSDLMRKFNVTSTESAAFTTTNQLRSDLDTIMPLRIGSEVSNPYNVSVDAFNINSSGTRWYTVPQDLKDEIWDIDFYQPLSEEQFAKLEKIGINKDSDWLFKQVDGGHALTQEWINKIGISDPNNTILKSQIPLSKEDQIIIDIVRQTSWDEVAQLVKNNNVIDNIYNSIKTIC